LHIVQIHPAIRIDAVTIEFQGGEVRPRDEPRRDRAGRFIPAGGVTAARQLTETGTLSASPIRLMPQFISGETV